MGHDVYAVANHQLNTSNMPMLAADLAARLNANVHYGYMDDLYIAGISNETFETVIIGKEEKQAATETWILLDRNYLDNLRRGAKSTRGIWYELYNSKDYEATSIDIFKHCFNPQISFYSRWWNFCRCFNGEINDWDSLNGYRKSVHSIIEQFGGNTAIYFDDQGKSAFIFDREEYAMFQEIHAEVESTFKEDYLNITAFVKQYPDFNFPRTDKYPLAFYDDFSDIQMVEHVVS